MGRSASRFERRLRRLRQQGPEAPISAPISAPTVTASIPLPPLVCAALPADRELIANGSLAPATALTLATPLVAFADTFRLHSNPTANTTIYLDFNGHTTTGTAWNSTTMGTSFYSPAFDSDGNPAAFNNTELTLIQRVWQRVAADFTGLDINVTTQEPAADWLIKTNASDPNYGIRVVISNFGPSSKTSGGIAYINSFTWDSDTPAYVYNGSLSGVSEASSHEAGHSLGLTHDGISTPAATYYQGHGSGENGWAPIMGASYDQSVSTWDSGSYYRSNNTGPSANNGKGADDLAVIVANNGVSVLGDQEGNSFATAGFLFLNGGSVSQFGSIETRTDTDWFRFDLLNPGAINLSFDPYLYRAFIDRDGIWGGEVSSTYATVSDATTSTAWVENGTNLDLAVDLLDSTGTVVASSNPAGLAASLNLTGLATGSYALRLDGVGFGTPTASTPSGYSDVGSLGHYRISGTISGADPTPAISLSLAPFAVDEDGPANLIYTVSRPTADPTQLTVQFSVAGSATNGVDYGAIGTSVTIAAGANSASLTLDPTPDGQDEGDETVALTLVAGSGYQLATIAPVIGVLRNDDQPLITLSLATATVLEDGTANLDFLFTRSQPSISPLTVSYLVGGSASVGGDYSGIAANGVVRTVTIAANATTAVVTANPTPDSTVEANEMVELTLSPGAGYRLGSAGPVIGTILNDDLPTVSLALTAATIAEDAPGQLSFSISRNVATADPLTVSYSLGGTASADSDYQVVPPATGLPTLTIPAFATSASLLVDPIADATFEHDETVVVSLASGNGYSLGSVNGAIGTIQNDDLPLISLSLSPTAITEIDGTTLTYRFERSGLTEAPLTVNFAVAGTATAGSDYEPIGTSVNFAAGEASATLTVTPVADGLVECDETVELNLVPSDAYAIASGSAVVATIVNSDLPELTLSLSPIQVNENGGEAMVVTVTRSVATATALTVALSLTGTADNGSDYDPIGSSLQFAPYAPTATLRVRPIQDALAEADETVVLGLSDGPGYRIGTSVPVEATILNVDLPAISLTLDALSVQEDSGTPILVTLSRSLVTAEPLTVDLSFGGSATPGLDYSSSATSVTFAAGEATASLLLTPTADPDCEADETIVLGLQPSPRYVADSALPLTALLGNDDLPALSLTLAPSSTGEDGPGTLLYTLQRTGPTTAPLTATLAVGGNAINGVDYGFIANSVTFATGASSATVVVDPLADGDYEHDETVSLALVAEAFYRADSLDPVTGLILNDDLPVILASLSPSAVNEDGPDPLIVTLTRSGVVDQALTVALAVGGTATKGVDYGDLPPSVSFAPGSSSATVVVTPIADLEVEPNETVSLTLLPDPSYRIGTPTAMVGTITNDDVPLISLAVAPAQVLENGAPNLIFTFSRTGPFTAPLTVAYGVGGSATHGVDYASLGTSLTFAAGASTASVTVNPTSDLTVEANETVLLTVLPGNGYRTLTPQSASGLILNDDLPGVTLSLAAPTAVAEDGLANLVFTVTRSVATADPLLVNVTTAGTATMGFDYAAIGSSVIIPAHAASATVVIDPLADPTIEANETVQLTLANGSGYTRKTTTAVTGTINNDDTVNPAPSPGADVLTFTSASDSLTGLGGADVFQMLSLTTSLFSATAIDRITDFAVLDDVIDTPVPRTTPLYPTVLGSVTALTTAAIGALLTSARFPANGAATFSFGSRSFLALNNATAGYAATTDALVEISGFSAGPNGLADLRVF